MAENKPAFSVLMSSYNKGAYIREAIRSVLNQTFPDWELVIIDDCSTDSSVEIIKEYLSDQRIRLYQNAGNKGCPFTLKRMMQESRADIVGILDGDDVLTEDAIAAVMEEYQNNPQCGVFYSKYDYCDSNLNFLYHGVDGKMETGKNNIHSARACAFRAYTKKAYNMTSGYDEKRIYAEDRDLILKLEEVTSFCFINKVLYKYRVLEDSQSHYPKTKIIGALAHIDAKYDAYQRRLNTAIPNLTKNQMSYEFIDAIFFSLKIGDFGRAADYLVKHIKLNPFHFSGHLWIFFRIVKFIPYRIISKMLGTRNNDMI